MSDSSGASLSTGSTESEVQRRRRLRQERILNRGGDRLSKIKSTFSQAQEEAGQGELGVVGGHEIKTAAEPHTAGVSLESLSASADSQSPQPRRRAGNLARKARQEAEARAAEAAPTAEKVASRGSRVRETVSAADINSDALHESVNAAIADPASESAILAAADVSDSAQSGVLRARRFSAIGLSRAIVKLAPVLGVYVYGLMRESSYEHLLGETRDEVAAKWSGLLVSRPDGRREEWAGGSFLLWYLLVLEVFICGAYFVLGDASSSGSNGGRRRRFARSSVPSMLAQIPGVPDWAFVALSAGGRMLDSLSVLLFLTAASITVAGTV
ncbi:hypothetical protein GGI15_004121 [Coemansia interrupta]|uniref:Uncharacterized protein n=1 Tax=Coemansia interrupta TaxID=1126814 RepID=A0A9W8HBI1_9FUNG|nr:hypothetical protein GGI15_004121 [Coemansia interrupta]